ncbi:MAG: threonine--tRNA ligase [Bacillota bacterium]|jgi:threonyl-tRNA synthetase
MSLTITFPDGSKKEYESVRTVGQVAADISRSLAKRAVGAVANGKTVALTEPLEGEVDLRIVSFDDAEGQDIYRHSSSHILAQAVQHLFPGTKFGIGPAVKDGFYYDFDSEHTFTTEDFAAIEAEMKKIIKANIPFEREELSREDALKMFAEQGEEYKVELINDLPEDAIISVYHQGDFKDLCAGPHLPTTGMVKAVKLLSLAGAYWRGDEKNKMLQRIYATSFPNKERLEQYIAAIEEAKKRDHRKIGAELELFMMNEDAPGFPFFLPKGMVLRNQLENFWRKEHEKRDYQEIKTPVMLARSLWEQSGHWEHYKDNMYFTKIDEIDYAIKPMNCPGGILVYKHKPHSYRELPIRCGELGLVHRHELSGALHGLMRVRCFTQDDAHIFMLPEQIKDEIKGVIELIDHVYKLFGFTYHIELSTKPEKAMGDELIWDKATAALQEAVTDMGIDFIINEGDGAFYGPKLDFHLKDCLGRTWQCGTIQLDFLLPEKFDLTYIGSDGGQHRPVVIHRVVFGSIERFIAILIEHYAGAFPLWLAPVQVKILNITDRQNDYAHKIAARLKAAGIRTEIDDRNEKIGYKIRSAQGERIPYMMVIGDKEMENGNIALRKRGKGDLGVKDLEETIDELLLEIEQKKAD